MEAKQLWISATGEVTCGDLHCAGADAHFGGMKERLGVRLRKLTPAKARQMQAELDTYGRGLKVQCEGCGAEPSVVSIFDGATLGDLARKHGMVPA